MFALLFSKLTLALMVCDFVSLTSQLYYSGNARANK
jgi:hypothetical protein